MMQKLKAYFELIKLRVNILVVLTVWLGYALAAPAPSPWTRLFHLLFGSTLMAGAGAALNQYLERDLDALMRRTQRRPLPEGRLSPPEALWFSVLLAVVGTLELWLCVNFLTSFLGLLTLISYAFVYTPLKRKTSLSTLVGAIPGAIPPLMGWAGATGHLDPRAWVLFTILYLWQLPHFLAIAWMYREDYARAGFPMLPVIDPDGGMTSRMILLYTAVLIPVTLMPTHMGFAGVSYLCGAVVLGACFFACGAVTAVRRTATNARRLLLVSVIYLPSLLTWMACSRPD
jgi:heme o synthase